MLTFSTFISEEAGKTADFSGKAYELELAKHLHPNKQYPEHHNDESGRSPEAVVKHLKGHLGDHAYGQIESHAKKAAEQIKSSTGHNIKRVFWTSVAGQVSKTTGHKEDDHPADLVYEHGEGKNKKFHSISAKFGKAPGARSPGMDDLAHMSGMGDKLHKMVSHHHEQVDKVMGGHLTSKSRGAKHQEFKNIVSGGSSEAKAAAKNANETSLQHRSNIAKHLSNHFNDVAKNDHSKMVENVRKLTASSDTHTPMIKVHSNPSNGKVEINNPSEEFHKAMSNVHHFSTTHSGSYVNIHAHDHNGNKHTIAKISIKNKSSSPFTNMVGAAKLGNGLKKLASSK